MSDIFGIVAVAILVIACIYLLFKVYSLRGINALLQMNITQQQADIELLGNRIAEISGLDPKTLEQEFIKFLSESREYAFKYIEDVQSCIVALKNAMDSGNEYEISSAYNLLIDFLPEDQDGMVK